MSHNIVSICLDTLSVILVVLFSALESRLAELCTHTCPLDCYHVGWVCTFTGSSVVAGQQSAPLLGWISSMGYGL